MAAAAADKPAVTVYESSVASTIKVKKSQESAKTLLKLKKIPFTAIDVSVDAKSKEFMTANSKAKDPHTLPQIFVNGVYRGLWEDLDMANEDGNAATFCKP